MLDQVERVEVVRGNVSAIYGSGAIGGVIRSSPGAARARREPPPKADPYGYARAAAQRGRPVGPLRAAIGISGQRAAASAQDAAANPVVNPDNDGYRNASGAASLRTSSPPDRRWASR